MYEHFAQVPDVVIPERKPVTDKKKRVSEMSDEEKKIYYALEVAKLEKRLQSAKAKHDKIGNVTEKQRNHALIVFGSRFLTREQIYEWYQLPAKERDEEIRKYADKIKAAVPTAAP